MIFPYGQPVDLLTRTVTGQDSDGNDVWGTTTTTIVGCAFDPGGSTELQQGSRDTVTTRPTVFLPAGTVVGAVDRVTVAGRTFEVDGTPLYYSNPFTGYTPGPVITLTRITG